MQLKRVDDCIAKLREQALEITNLMSFVSLNMAAIRKFLKKMAKKIDSEGPHGPGSTHSPPKYHPSTLIPVSGYMTVHIAPWTV